MAGLPTWLDCQLDGGLLRHHQTAHEHDRPARPAHFLHRGMPRPILLCRAHPVIYMSFYRTSYNAMRRCIYSGTAALDGASSPLGDRAVVDERCTLAELGKAVHTRDALDVGFPDQWGLDLLWRLLRWDPMERISVSEALEHAYFSGPYRSRRDGSLHATQR